MNNVRLFRNYFAAPTDRVRRRKGVGDFGAYRSAHPTIPHRGQDYFAEPGEPVYSPISGKVRIAKPYKTDSRYSGVEVTGAKFATKTFYIDPVVSGGEMVVKGQLIGYTQDLSKKYGASFLAQNHVHIEVRENGILRNPDKYFQPDDPTA